MTVRLNRQRLLGALKVFGTLSAAAAIAVGLPFAGERLEAQEKLSLIHI